MNITKTNNLSFYNEQGILTLNAKQFDTGRKFVFHIMDNDEPFDLPENCTAYLRIAKADGTQFQGHECCKIEGSKITIDPSVGNGSQILAAAGTNICELHLEDADGISLTTWSFNIFTEPRVHDGSHITSIDSYDVIDVAIAMEKERVKNEQIRINNEAKRIECEEHRIFEEAKRQENETERQNTFGNVLSKAETYVTTASVCAYNAKKSEINSTNCEENALNHAAEAKSWAHGGTGVRDGEDTDNAKYYKEEAQKAFEDLKSSTVIGVKGDAESEYRIGNINITPENVGALSLKKGGTVNNTFKVNKVSTTNPTGLTEIDIHNDGKIAFNTTERANGDNSDSLLYLKGDNASGEVTINGSTLKLKPLSELWIETDHIKFYSPMSIISHSPVSMLAEDLLLGYQSTTSGNDVPRISIGDDTINMYFADSSSGAPTREQSIKLSISETNLYGNYFHFGNPNDPFIQLERYTSSTSISTSKWVKIRGGTNSHILLDINNDVILGSDNGNFIFKNYSYDHDSTIENTYVNAMITSDGIFKLFTDYDHEDLTYDLTLDGYTGLNLHNYMYYDASGILCKGTSSKWGRFNFFINASEASFNIYSNSSLNLTKNLGTPSYKWTNIYATNGTIQTSDRNEKNTIEEITNEKAEKLIYGLKPSTYQMNSGASGRTHWGMISQDIEELLEELGWTSLDFAGFIKSPKMHIEEEERDENGKIIKERVEEVIEGEYDYSLRYDEFIAPMIKVIQTQHEEIQNQKQHIETLEKRLELLEQKLLSGGTL